jgi:hypothetical protein
VTPFIIIVFFCTFRHFLLFQQLAHGIILLSDNLLCYLKNKINNAFNIYFLPILSYSYNNQNGMIQSFLCRCKSI